MVIQKRNPPNYKGYLTLGMAVVKKGFWILLLSCCFFTGSSQPLNLSFEQARFGDGLPSRFSDFIKKDSRGFVWISSMEGVYRFDGIAVKHFTPGNTVAGEKEGLLSKDIQSDFFEDRKGNIWFSPINGINCYERASGNFQSFYVKDENDADIKDGYCLFFLERDSTLWLKANGYIYRYNPFTGEQEKIVETKGMRFDVDTFPGGYVRSIYACPWLMGPGVEVTTFSSSGTVVKRLFLENGISPNSNEFVTVSKAIVESDSLAWLFSNHGLIAFNRYQPELTQYSPLPSTENDFVKDGVILDKEYLLVTTKNSGLWLFNRQELTFTPYNWRANNQPGSLASNDLREVYVDGQHHLWLSYHDKAGISQSWMHRNHFDNPFLGNFERLPIVTSIIEDGQRRVWCATQQQGVLAFDLDGKPLPQYRNSLDSRSRDLPTIRQLSVDENGVAWGLADHAIYRHSEEGWRKIFQSEKETFFNLLHLSNTHKLISSNQGLFELKFDGIWQRQEREDGAKYQFFYAFPSKKKGFFFLANQSNEWVPCQYQDGHFQPGNAIAPGGDVYAAWEGEEGDSIVLGTSNGALLVDLVNRHQLSNLFPKHELLRNTQVYAIFQDAQGKYWLESNQGIWNYDPCQPALYQYRTEDGLASQEFSLYANLKASDGKIWLGTNEGALVFDPDAIRPYPYGPRIQIQSLLVNQEPHKTGINIDEIKTLDFNHRQNTFELEAVAITHYLARFNQLYYRLEGYEEKWQSLANGGSIQYLKIPPGNYTLKIYGSNANGVTGPVRELAVNISPPFWKTAWFFVLTFLVLASCAYLLFRFYLNRRLQQQQHEFDRREELRTALQEERNRIAGEMHEDLGGGLTSIQLLLKKIEKNGLLEESVLKLKKVDDQATKLVKNMREIIWAMNSSYDNLPDLAAYLRHSVVEYLDDLGIQCEATIFPVELPNLLISGKKRRNIFLCIKESAHNIVKHANASKVRFTISYKDDLELEIKDNGRGLSPEKDIRFCNGLKNMKMRMEQIGGHLIIEGTKGVTVKLTVPLDQEKV